MSTDFSTSLFALSFSIVADSSLAVNCSSLYYHSDVLHSVFKHDPSKVAVCRSFLQNRCTDISCPLCHTADPVRSYHAVFYYISSRSHTYAIIKSRYPFITHALTCSFHFRILNKKFPSVSFVGQSTRL
jgi:hypothetical protein